MIERLEHVLAVAQANQVERRRARGEGAAVQRALEPARRRVLADGGELEARPALAHCARRPRADRHGDPAGLAVGVDGVEGVDLGSIDVVAARDRVRDAIAAAKVVLVVAAGEPVGAEPADDRVVVVAAGDAVGPPPPVTTSSPLPPSRSEPMAPPLTVSFPFPPATVQPRPVNGSMIRSSAKIRSFSLPPASTSTSVIASLSRRMSRGCVARHPERVEAAAAVDRVDSVPGCDEERVAQAAPRELIGARPRR